MALDVAFNSPTPTVKIGALHFLVVLMLVFPQGVSHKIQEIRDTLRACIIDKDREVSDTAYGYYPLVFKIADITVQPVFYQYLKSEISSLIQNREINVEAGDPLVNQLALDEAITVLKSSITCYGSFNDRNLSLEIIRDLILILKGTNSAIRSVALEAILSQVRLLSDNQANVILWQLIPLYADPNTNIRQIFARHMKSIPSYTDVLIKFLPPSVDDSSTPPQTSWENVLMENAVISSNITSLLDSHKPLPLNSIGARIVISEDNGLYLPIVSLKLLDRIKNLVKNTTGIVQLPNITEVVYFLEQLLQNENIQGSIILVLSEFGRMHETAIPDLMTLFINHLGHEISSHNSSLIEACILGLENMLGTQLAMMDSMINKLSSTATANEGDIFALCYFSDKIKDNAVKCNEIIQRFVPFIANPRYSVKKRLYAIFLLSIYILM